jgi:hypothetical protein
MSQATTRVLVAGVVGVTVALEAVAVALAAGVVPIGAPLLYALYATVQAVAGAIIIWRYPRHRVGWLLAAFALGNAVLSDAAAAYGQRGYVEGWPGAAFAELVGLTSWLVGALGLTMLFLVFPDGRYLSPRWRWVPAVWLAGAVMAVPGWSLNPRLGNDMSAGVNPLATDALPVDAMYAAGASLVSTALVTSVVALLVRYAKSRGAERQKLKWVLFAGAVLTVVLPLSAALWTAWLPVRYLPALALPLLPVAVCVAIVREQLYDIDLVISRTVAYGGAHGGARRDIRDRGARGWDRCRLTVAARSGRPRRGCHLLARATADPGPRGPALPASSS